MRPNQMIAAAIREMRDVALCQSCGGILDFVTNGFGGVVQRCSRCGREGRMQLAPEREIGGKGREVQGPPCVDCGGPTKEFPGGKHAKRCFACRAERNKQTCREFQRQRRKSA